MGGIRSPIGSGVAPRDARAEGDTAAVRQRINGIEDEIGERLANFTFNADQFRHVGRKIRLHSTVPAA